MSSPPSATYTPHSILALYARSVDGLRLRDSSARFMHEDVLFSCFEEPCSHVNILKDPQQESQAIQGWLDVNPEAHFVRLPGSNGANFLLPEYFAIG